MRPVPPQSFAGAPARRFLEPDTKRHPQVQQLIDYETEHGNRLPVQVVLEQRLDALKNGATPSGQIDTEHPEIPAASTSPGVSPATTTAPAINPTSHGDPTNPS